MITTQFFQAAGQAKNFIFSRAGSESLCNNKSSPCKSCRSDMDGKRFATEDGFISRLIGHYPGLTRLWFYETFEVQGGRGKITNTALKLTSNQVNCVGVHRYDNEKEHVPENCFLEVQELNIPQHDSILSLMEAWTNVFQHFINAFAGREDSVDYMQNFREQFMLTLKILGITKSNCSSNNEYNVRCREMHFESILMSRINAHIQHDIEANRF